jgi:hypothetical protein
MPKLYFHDTGLACWLLGIRELRQLRAHPLRGSLFETWVVSEAVKHRTHRGRSGGLSFYRDRHGAELDLVVDEPDALTLVEAKSAATPAPSLFDGVRRVRPRLQDLRSGCNTAVVYGGEEPQQRTHGRLIPWRLVLSAVPPKVEPLVQVFADGQPVADADVLALFPDRTWRSTRTDERGRARLRLDPGHLPMTVFAAGDGFAPHEEPAWIPDERALHVQLTVQPGGGARILDGVTPGREVEVMVKGKVAIVDLVEGQQCVLELNAAESRDPTGPGWASRRQFVLRVVKVFDGAALLEYGPVSDQPATDS